jgi:hypothetical protein
VGKKPEVPKPDKFTMKMDFSKWHPCDFEMYIRSFPALTALERTNLLLGYLDTDVKMYVRTIPDFETLSYSSLVEYLSRGPFKASETNLSGRTMLVTANYGSLKPVQIVKKVKELLCSLPDMPLMADQIFYALCGLKDFPALYSKVSHQPDGKEWRDFQELQDFVQAIIASDPSFNDKHPTYRGKLMSTPPAKRPAASHPKFTSKKARSSGKPTTGDGASGSGGGGADGFKKRDTYKKCLGCSSPDHEIGDSDKNGKPICPKFNAKKHFLKGNK